MRADVLAQRVEKLVTERNLLKNQLTQSQSRLETISKRLDNIHQAREILKKVAIQTQAGLEFRINSIVSSALAAVFPDPYEFRIRFVERRNKMECDLLFVKNEEEFSPLDDTGGGAVDVASLALRVVFWSLRKGRPTFVMDEPVKFLSDGRQERASAMIKMLSEKMGLQFIIVSHMEHLIKDADRVFVVTDGTIRRQNDND